MRYDIVLIGGAYPATDINPKDFRVFTQDLADTPPMVGDFVQVVGSLHKVLDIAQGAITTTLIVEGSASLAIHMPMTDQREGGFLVRYVTKKSFEAQGHHVIGTSILAATSAPMLGTLVDCGIGEYYRVAFRIITEMVVVVVVIDQVLNRLGRHLTEVT